MVYPIIFTVRIEPFGQKLLVSSAKASPGVTVPMDFGRGAGNDIWAQVLKLSS
jgi:hypothetical protein